MTGMPPWKAWNTIPGIIGEVQSKFSFFTLQEMPVVEASEDMVLMTKHSISLLRP